MIVLILFNQLELALEIKKLEEEGRRSFLNEFLLILTIRCLLGVKLAEQNQLSEAIERFNQAIALDPKQPSAYNNRAQAYQLQNRIDGSIIFSLRHRRLILIF